jgi:anti-sigma factor RsiW
MSSTSKAQMSERLNLGDAIRDALPVYEAPTALRDWAREEARKLGDSPDRIETPVAAPRRIFSGRSQLGIAAGFVIAIALGWGAGSRWSNSTGATQESTINAVVDAHVRSMLPGHLLDVVSTDRHTVKPWFAGKTDLAPAVLDLSDQGFPLLGGRLDYVAGHTAAALAYGRRLHTINLFVWRSGDREQAGSFVSRGYSIAHWTSAGLSYWAITDAAPSELEAFREAYTK